MTTLSVTQAAKDFSGMLRRVAAGHEAVILKRGHRVVAAMIPPEMIEELENLEDIREADKAMAEYERNPSGAVSLAEYERRREGKKLSSYCRLAKEP